ncbi:hypothetical protein EHH54_33890 [Rhizobium leguminosarum]|uniref:hypothetical protein n=1 Tax=Rhizobium leguminosarum TaxID=384 RepID=UPI000E0FBC6B|nr:hypothetical protein [Rhizobium leguminosarum]RWX27252.1 hypothetical protein EHH54_33890 [Rhizobium leguminosarum]
MKIWYSGNKSKALCETCRKVVATTFDYHDVPFESGIGVAKQIMAATCDECGTVVAIPPQSTPAIRVAREIASRPLEVVMAAPFMDTLDLASYRIDPSAGVLLRKKLIAYFVHRSLNDDSLVERLRRNAEVHRAKWKSWHDAPSKRLSMKVTPRVGDEFDELIKKSALNKTTLVKSIVMDIGSEIVEPEEPQMMPELRRMAAALAA